MKKSIILIVAMIFFFQLSQKAQAAFYLEPFAGMLVNSTFEVENAAKGKIDGSHLGGRVGWTKMGFSLGLDGRRTSFRTEPDSNINDEEDYTATQSGFFVGYDLPIAIRVWANYIFSSEASNDDDSDRKFKDGSGYNIGIGYKPLPFISLNLEMFKLDYAKYVDALGETDLQYESSGMVLGISIPVSI